MRIKVLQIFFIIAFILLGASLYYLQIVKGEMYRNLSSRNSIRLLNIESARGMIYDRYNDILADNILSFGVFIVPQEVEDLDDEIKKLSRILDISESVLKRNYKRNYTAPFAPCELTRNISKEEAIRIEELKLDMPGVLVKEISIRRYPYGEAFLHVIGYLGEIDRRELESLRGYGYSVKDIIGKDGVECSFDSFLRGTDGGMQIQVDNKGRQVKVLNFKKSRRGKDVYLTIDAGLQNLVWKMMKGKKGAAIFMEPHTGEILCMVSAPSYDANSGLGHDVFNSTDAPLLNRCISGQYAPGSLFKIVVAIAGIETDKIEPDKIFFCRGSLNIGNDVFNCWNRDGHGAMDLKDAIIESCNSYFYNLGLLLKVEKMCDYAREFGIGKKTGIELFGEKEGFVPSRIWKKMEYKDRWYAGDTANLSIGQGYLLVTPLQLVRLLASVANGGKLVEPHILKRIGDVDVIRNKSIRLNIKKENIDFVKDAMKGVVNDKDGTGVCAHSEIVSISGKTGTSQTGSEGKTHGLFGGFAPSEHPEISFVIFLEYGGSGGDMPALIAKRAVEYWYRKERR